MSFTGQLNREQQLAATSLDGPVLILAGAGSGKTRTVTSRIANMVNAGVDPAGILAVTFTNKAAGEMKERVREMVGKQVASELTVCTFHSLCVRVLRHDIERLGYKGNFTILDHSEQISLIKKIIIRLDGKQSKLEAYAALNAMSAKRNTGEDFPMEHRELLTEVAKEYGVETRLINAVDFDDLLVLAVRVLRDYPEVRSAWQRTFERIMVDEFQDTNSLQMELMRLLTGPEMHICVVGDDDQSIYGWRGADLNNILDFERFFPNPLVVKLEENYRSVPTILAVSNSLIRHNKGRREKVLRSRLPGGEPVRLVEMETDQKEAEFVAEEIWERARLRGQEWEDFAILFRTNQQSRVLEKCLRAKKVPYRIVGARSFFDRREVREVLGYLTLLVNPDEDASLLRVINTPTRGIGATVIDGAQEWSVKKRESVWKALADPEFRVRLTTRQNGALNDFVGMVTQKSVRSLMPGADAVEIMEEWLEEISFPNYLRSISKNDEELAARQEAVRQLLDGLRAFLGERKGGVTDYLRAMMLDDRMEDEKDDITKKKGVCLITLHAAKGLEFPEVYLVGMEDGILPHHRSSEGERREEERRLLYVGITRAMKRLTITYCDTRMKWGNAVPCQPSSFLKEIDPATLEVTSRTEINGKVLSGEEMSGALQRMREMLRANED